MAAVMDGGGTGSDVVTTAPRRSRRRRWIGVAALVGLLIASWIVLDRMVLSYAPIEFGTTYGYDGDHRDIEELDGVGWVVFPFDSGAEFSATFNLTNAGDRSVRVVDLPQENPWYYATRTGVEIGDGETDGERFGGGAPATWLPFEAFTLVPGQFRMVRMTYQFAECPALSDAALADETTQQLMGSWETQPVVFEVFGIERHGEFHLPQRMGLEGAIGDCTPQYPQP